MKKHLRVPALTLSLCLMLSGCSKAPYSGESGSVISLPEPSLEPVTMILGERIVSKPRSVTLYYVAGDGTSFSTITRSLSVSSGESFYKKAVASLLGSATTADRTAFIPGDAQVLDVEFACGIATVNLSLGAHRVQSGQEYLMLMASISNSLLSLEEVRGVNVLINGRSVSIASLPSGIRNRPFTGITPAYAQLNAENDYFLESGTGTITRNTALYFPDSQGTWFVPELREVHFDDSDYAAALLHELSIPPMESSCAAATLPDDTELLTAAPAITVTPDGQRILQLEFAAELNNYLAFSGLEQWQFLGSVVLTVCSFIPEIDAVIVNVGGEPVTECSIGEHSISFDEGHISRAAFASQIGSTVFLWLPNEDNTLVRTERAVSMDRASSPVSRLQVLFDNILTSVGSPFPEGVYHTDILGISVDDGVATVNLSANFYRQCQALDAAAERGVIYAIVNTLCELDNISAVRFFIEGITAETLSGSIYLKGILLPNPGLIASAPSAVPEITAIP